MGVLRPDLRGFGDNEVIVDDNWRAIFIEEDGLVIGVF